MHCLSFFFRSTRDNGNNKRQEFWNGTLVDDYNFLMSEELICRCKVSSVRYSSRKFEFFFFSGFSR